MILTKPNKINHLHSNCRSYAWLLVFIFSFLWSSENSHAQSDRTVTATKTYTSNGTFTITDLSDITGFDPTSEIFANANVDILIVGGGGGGGRGNSSGGGGGGQVLSQNIDLNLGATLNITIGQGGRGARQSGNNSNNGQAGGNTTVNLTSGSTSINYSANRGRGGSTNGNGGASGNGNTGGSNNGEGQNAKGGGGGGADGLGTDGFGRGASSTGGNGGNGVNISITGSRYGAGGGGNGRNGGNGGLGGGGDANPAGPGGNASLNSGSGGGAGRTSSPGGNGSNGIVIVQITYRILAVEYLYFNVNYNALNRSGEISWSTAKEWENSHFEIERAINSTKDWETIGQVSGKGFSDGPQAYKFRDTELPIFGGNIFYRLKQVDFSDNFEYSQTRAISIEGVNNSGIWVAFPNPSNSTSTLNLGLTDPSKYQDEKIFVYLADIKGRGVNFSAYSEEEASTYLSEFLKSSPKGIYILKIYWGDHFQLIKIIRG
jgi:hypothetical protein